MASWPGPHEHRGPMLGMSCMACYSMIKHWVYCSWATNTINICLIISTIYIFIPVSGCVGRAQVHCFARGPIMLLRRPSAREQEIILIEMYKPRIQFLQINGMFTTREVKVCWVNWISNDPQFEFRYKVEADVSLSVVSFNCQLFVIDTISDNSVRHSQKCYLC